MSNRSQTQCENKSLVNWDYKIGDNILLCKQGILWKSETKCHCDPWTISTLYMNGTIRVQHRPKSEQLNTRRVSYYFNSVRTNTLNVTNYSYSSLLKQALKLKSSF